MEMEFLKSQVSYEILFFGIGCRKDNWGPVLFSGGEGRGTRGTASNIFGFWL